MSMEQISPERADAAARMQENLIAYFRLFAGLRGVTAADADVFWFANAAPEPGNHVLRTHIPDDLAGQRIDEILDEIGRHTDHMDWLIFPSCRPADLGRRLEARGMPGGPAGNWMLAELPLRPPELPVPPGFRFEQVRDAETLAEWARVSAAGFGGDTQIFYDAYARHGFGPDASALHYIGYLDDEPATSSTLLLAGGIAGVYDISTPSHLRRRGLGSAITFATAEEARARGQRRVWAWASQLGRPIYERLGFTAADFGLREYRWRRR